MSVKATKDLELRIKAKNESGAGFDSAKKSIKDFASEAEKTTKSHATQVVTMGSAWSSFSNMVKNTGSSMYSSFTGFRNIINSIGSGIINLGSKIVELGMDIGKMVFKAVAAFVNLNAEFEVMKITLDTVTRGKGEEWFNKLNTWALDMPVSMAEVTKSFTVMKAYGLEPTLKMMETLIDTASILPDSARAMSGIARALGQITAKGRLEGQELRQLAEWAVPGYEAVYEKIFKRIAEKTGKSVGDLKFTMIDAATANKAILETMEEHFGGAAKKIAGTWTGLMTRLTNYTKEFFRQVGESGAMGELKEQLKRLVEDIANSFKTGEFAVIASFVGESLTIAFKSILKIFEGDPSKTWADTIVDNLKRIIYLATFLSDIFNTFKIIYQAIKYAWLGYSLAVTTGLSVIIQLVDNTIFYFGKLINALPNRFPYVKELKEGFAAIANESSKTTENVQRDLYTLHRDFNLTGKEIGKTSDKLGDSYAKAEIAVLELDTALNKLELNNRGKGMKPLDMGGLGESPEIYGPTIPIPTYSDVGPPDLKTFIEQLQNSGSLIDQLKAIWITFTSIVEKNPFKRLMKDVKEWINALKSGFSDAYANILKGDMNLREGFNATMKVMREAFIKSLADMLAEETIIQGARLAKHIFFEEAKTVATVAGDTTRVASNATAETTSVGISLWGTLTRMAHKAAEAAANVYTWFTGLGPFGMVVGLGVAALAASAVMKFAKFEKGTGLEGVNKTGPAILHQGEIVLNKKESDAYREGARSGGGSSSINLSFNITSMDSTDMERVVRKKIIPMIRSNIRDFGKGRTMIREAM